MTVNSGYGFPYPLSSEPVANGASNIQSLASAVDSKMGLFKIATGSVTNQSQIVFDGCFSSLYLNYLVVMAVSTATSTDVIRWQERVGGVNAASAYSWAGAAYYLSAGSGFQNILAGQNLVNGAVGSFDGASGSSGHCVFEIHSPNTSAYTSTTGRFSFATGNTGMYHGTVGSTHYVSTVYDGFRLFVNSGAFTAQVTVYGYRL